MAIRWTTKREVVVSCEMLVRVGGCIDGQSRYAEPDDLRAACAAVGMEAVPAGELAAETARANSWQEAATKAEASESALSSAVDELNELMSAEVAVLEQLLAEAAAQRDEARGALGAVCEALGRHLSTIGGRVSDPLRAIDTLAQRVNDARSDYREHDVQLSAIVDRLTAIIDEAFGAQPVMTPEEMLSFLEARLSERRREMSAAISRAEKAEKELGLRVQVGDITVLNSGDATKVDALHERIRELEAELALAQGVSWRAAQSVIECIGSVGPEDADSAAERIVSRVATLEARLAALTAPVDGELSDDEIRVMGEVSDTPGGLALCRQLYRLGVHHERERTVELRAEVSEARADRDKAIAELEAANLRIAELEAPLPEATVDELERAYRAGSGGFSGPATVFMNGGIRAVAERVRRERCLIARAVAANIDVRVAEDQGGGFLVAAHRAGEDEDVERNVPAAEVPAELARMLTEVGA